jgi:hypothetical protein
MLTVALSSAAVLGLASGLLLFLVALIQGLALTTDLITPRAYQSEQLKAQPIGVGQFEPDLAWPFYPFRQARADLIRVRVDLGRRYRTIGKWPVEAFFRGRHGSRLFWWFFFPIPLVTLSWLIAMGLAALFCYALFAAVSGICLAATVAVFGGIVRAARGGEQLRRRRRRTEASCPRCFHVTPWPAYRCPICSARHRDVRPGRLGLILRRCACGAHLPTMALRAAWRLQATCQRCGEPLPRGTGALRDIRIVIFGDTSAGKTRFLYACLNSLITAKNPAPVRVDFPDQISRDQIGQGLDVIRSGRDTVKTSATLPSALTCQLGAGRRATLAHLFDTAGEHYRDAQMHDALGFLHHGHGFVYVLDPFSIRWVRDRLTGHNAEAIRLAHMAAGDPETAYVEVISRLRDGGVASGSQRLAVIISKADLLRASGLEIPVDSAAIADWLTQAGVHNLVLSARREFAEARYFTVASRPTAGNDPRDDPGTPLRWLLRSYGVRLPTDPAEAAASHHPRVSPTVPETERAAS